jgi:hypothetical protein
MTGTVPSDHKQRVPIKIGLTRTHIFLGQPCIEFELSIKFQNVRRGQQIDVF